MQSIPPDLQTILKKGLNFKAGLCNAENIIFKRGKKTTFTSKQTEFHDLYLELEAFNAKTLNYRGHTRLPVIANAIYQPNICLCVFLNYLLQEYFEYLVELIKVHDELLDCMFYIVNDEINDHRHNMMQTSQLILPLENRRKHTNDWYVYNKLLDELFCCKLNLQILWEESYKKTYLYGNAAQLQHLRSKLDQIILTDNPENILNKILIACLKCDITGKNFLKQHEGMELPFCLFKYATGFIMQKLLEQGYKPTEVDMHRLLTNGLEREFIENLNDNLSEDFNLRSNCLAQYLVSASALGLKDVINVLINVYNVDVNVETDIDSRLLYGDGTLFYSSTRNGIFLSSGPQENFSGTPLLACLYKNNYASANLLVEEYGASVDINTKMIICYFFQNNTNNNNFGEKILALLNPTEDLLKYIVENIFGPNTIKRFVTHENIVFAVKLGCQFDMRLLNNHISSMSYETVNFLLEQFPDHIQLENLSEDFVKKVLLPKKSPDIVPKPTNKSITLPFKSKVQLSAPFLLSISSENSADVEDDIESDIESDTESDIENNIEDENDEIDISEEVEIDDIFEPDFDRRSCATNFYDHKVLKMVLDMISKKSL
jgi:hypothetical protein